MGFLKNGAIKSTTKKRFYQIMGLIENDLRDNPKADPMDILNALVMGLKMQGINISIPADITHWTDAIKLVVAVEVKLELGYDSTIGSREDFDLVMETINKEVEKFKQR